MQSVRQISPYYFRMNIDFTFQNVLAALFSSNRKEYFVDGMETLLGRSNCYSCWNDLINFVDYYVAQKMMLASGN